METNEIEEALIKKAVGFLAEEVIEEFAIDETGNSVLTKKRRTTKQVPPDVSAIKILLSYFEDQSLHQLNAMTNEELLARRDLLLAKLQKVEEKKESL